MAPGFQVRALQTCAAQTRARLSAGMRGFGLLEAIVALALLAGLGGVLFSWLGQSLGDVARVEGAQRRAELKLQALALIATVNPAMEPAGERRLAGLQVRWTSALIAPMRISMPSNPMESPRWRVGLYRLQVAATGMEAGDAVNFDFEQQGLLSLDTAEPPARLSTSP